MLGEILNNHYLRNVLDRAEPDRLRCLNGRLNFTTMLSIV